MSKRDRDYALTGDSSTEEMPAPTLDYTPPMPRCPANIGLIGCGGITNNHLNAYKEAGWNVIALADKHRPSAEDKQTKYFPNALIYEDYRDLLKNDALQIVDIATHPDVRAPIIRDAIKAGKHILSQKPFVKDLNEGLALLKLSQEYGVKIAVNQNGRFAPYVRYIDKAIQAGLIGEPQSIVIHINWDHTWTENTPFNEVHHLVLYDFGIHWFDMVHCFFRGKTAHSVSAQNARIEQQTNKPPLLGCALLQFDSGLATVSFDAGSQWGPQEYIQVSGSKGTLRAHGPVVNCNQLELHTEKGVSFPELKGKWFDDGFKGAMGELMCAIEENREPENGAADNLESLRLCFASLHSADCGTSVLPSTLTNI